MGRKRQKPPELEAVKAMGKQCNEPREGDIPVQQSAHDAADIRRISRGLQRSGLDPFRPDGTASIPGRGPGIFGDFSDAQDFIELHQRVRQVEREFMALDPKARREFDNDPAKLIEWLNDTEVDADTKREEAIRLGLLDDPEKAPPSVPVQIADAIGEELTRRGIIPTPKEDEAKPAETS